jgi:hypothetical protein
MMPKRARSPQEKKELSLKKDRRNTFGENAKSSRKNIAKSKALSHQKVRSKARQALHGLEQLPDVGSEVVESTLLTARLQKGRWKKSADTPLADVIKRKQEGREGRAYRRKPKPEASH